MALPGLDGGLAGTKVLFLAKGAGHFGRDLWETDGTATGTKLVRIHDGFRADRGPVTDSSHGDVDVDVPNDGEAGPWSAHAWTIIDPEAECNKYKQ